MLMEECGRCKYKASFIGIGLGVRCTHPNNQKYKLEIDNQSMPVIISRVPSLCPFKETYQRRKIILHIPHSSTFLPDTFNVLEGVSLEGEFQRMTDWFTDELFNFDKAVQLIFPYSRLYCDVERFRSDIDEPMAKKGMGVCYTQTSYGARLRDVGSKEKTFIKSAIYDEHHKNLEILVEEELSKNDCALIIDCHSFSDAPLPHEDNAIRPDICIGTDSLHTPRELLTIVRKYFELQGLSIAINEPFSGTMVPLKYYGKDRCVQSIMIEINRKLYLNEKFKKNDNFHKVKELIQNLLKHINQHIN